MVWLLLLNSGKTAEILTASSDVGVMVTEMINMIIKECTVPDD